MWNITQPNRCLQSLSDALVNNLHAYRTLNQTIPSWIYDLPNEEERKYKIELIDKYGSPNVFEQFQPHVTVGFSDDDDPQNRSMVDRYNIFFGSDRFVHRRSEDKSVVPRSDCFAMLNIVSVGVIGDFGGVVLRKPEPWIYVTLQQQPEDSFLKRNQYSSIAY